MTGRVNHTSNSIQVMSEEGGQTESIVSKDMVKEALAELLQEMPIFRGLSTGSSSQPAAAVAGLSREKSILWEPWCWRDASTGQLIGVKKMPILDDGGVTEYGHVGAVDVQLWVDVNATEGVPVQADMIQRGGS